MPCRAVRWIAGLTRNTTQPHKITIMAKRKTGKEVETLRKRVFDLENNLVLSRAINKALVAKFRVTEKELVKLVEDYANRQVNPGQK